MAGSIWDGPTKGGESNAEDALRAADSAVLHDALLASVRRGWLISIGRSRDGGSLSLAILDGGEVQRVWCSTSGEVEAALTRVTEAATDLDAAPPQKGNQRSKKRP